MSSNPFIFSNTKDSHKYVVRSEAGPLFILTDNPYPRNVLDCDAYGPPQGGKLSYSGFNICGGIRIKGNPAPYGGLHFEKRDTTENPRHLLQPASVFQAGIYNVNNSGAQLSDAMDIGNIVVQMIQGLAGFTEGKYIDPNNIVLVLLRLYFSLPLPVRRYVWPNVPEDGSLPKNLLALIFPANLENSWAGKYTTASIESVRKSIVDNYAYVTAELKKWKDEK